MKILRQLTLPFGEEKSTSSPGGFRASLFQSQENGKVQPITVTSGRKCLEQFVRFAQNGSWAKTFSELLVGTEEWFSSRCTLIWKLKGSKFKRLYFQLVASAPRTRDTEHGLLLKTPNAMDARSERLTKKEQRFGNSGTLAQEVQTGFIYKRGLLPTIQTQGMKVCKRGKSVFAPMSMLPTPCATDVARGALKDVKYENGTYFRENKKLVRFGVHITDLIASGFLPTPTANDGTNSTLPESQLLRKSGIAKIACKLKDGQTSQLNPLFVQEMMGFPYLWTESPFQDGEQNPSKPTETR